MNPTRLFAFVLSGSVLLSAVAYAQLAPVANTAVQSAAAAQKQPLLDSIREFVNIETGSRDHEGITQATELLGNKLRALGGQVQFFEPQEATTYQMMDTPEKYWSDG